MKQRCAYLVLLAVLGTWEASAVAQQAAASSSAPTLVRLDGQLKTDAGAARTGSVTLVVSLYAEKDDTTPLWVEQQPATLDAAGRYTIYAGSTLPDGVPQTFLSGSTAGRWVGVGVQGEPEQFRMMLVTVPYAAKAREADTLAGKSLSDFVLTSSLSATAKAALKASGVGLVGTSGSTPGTSSTAGALGKDDGAGTTIFSTNAFEVGGNVGIGTSTPSTLLHVKGASYPIANVEGTSVNGGLLQLTSSVNNWQTYNQTGDLRFSTSTAPGGDRVTFTSAGNVGIGTVAPAFALDINKSFAGQVTASIRNVTAGAGNYARLDIKTDGAGGRGLFDAYSSTFATSANSVAGGVSFTGIGPGGFSIAHQDATAPIRFYTGAGPSEQMRITSGGFVGIGTTTPTQKLDVAGDINLTGRLRQGGGTILTTSSAGSTTALGISALSSNTGGFNTAAGYNALKSNNTGFGNTAIGALALSQNTAAGNNTAVGVAALQQNTGDGNTAIGASALTANATGFNNTATGNGALSANTTGFGNTAAGNLALSGNTTGIRNVALGRLAGSTPTIGNYNIFLGEEASGTAADTNVIRIGNPYNGAATPPSGQNQTFIAGIRGITTGLADAVSVVIDSNGQLGTISSSRRFKEDIRNMAEASHDLLRLHPVTFRYQRPFADGSKPIQYGLIAEEVAEVYPDLVAHSADGQVETVKYQVLDVMLLNEVQRQQAELRALEQQNQDLTRKNQDLQQQHSELQQRLTAVEAALALRTADR